MPKYTKKGAKKVAKAKESAKVSIVYKPITRSQIIEILTPNCETPVGPRIHFDDYIIRKDLLTRRLEHIMTTLQTSYSAQLPEFFDKITKVTPAITLLARRCNFGNGMLRSYLFDLYGILYYLRYININMDNSIQYDDIVHD